MVHVIGVRVSPDAAAALLPVNDSSAGGILLASIPTQLTVHRSSEYTGPRVTIVASSPDIFRLGSRIREACQIVSASIPVRTLLTADREKTWIKKPVALPAQFLFDKPFTPGSTPDLPPAPLPTDEIEEGRNSSFPYFFFNRQSKFSLLSLSNTVNT